MNPEFMNDGQLTDEQVRDFQTYIHARGAELYRDLPWRNTRDPYEVLVSEVMLQQTQVKRVLVKWQEWLEAFPTLRDLAEAPLAPVLEVWQGLGYNRRAIALKNCAEQCMERLDGALPQDEKSLQSLPGIGPATASGVRAFAFGLPGVYLETNVRTVFLHEFFPGQEGVTDKTLIPLIEQTCDTEDSRMWYYALLDYGVVLKKELSNPSRRSAHHTTQSKFEGSRRQKRAWLLRAVLAEPFTRTAEDLIADLSAFEAGAGRPPLDETDGETILESLQAEGFIARDASSRWGVA